MSGALRLLRIDEQAVRANTAQRQSTRGSLGVGLLAADSPISVGIPAGLGWVNAPVFIRDLAIGVKDFNTGRLPHGYCNFDVAQNAAYQACLAGLHCYSNATTGSDSTGDGTEAKPYRSIKKSVDAINASGSPGVIYVEAGLYDKAANFSIGASTNVPTQDIIFMARNGRVLSTAHDSSLSWSASADGTYGNCYTMTVSVPARCVNLKAKDANGLYPDFLLAESAALCNTSPGTMYYDGTKLYLNRGDGKKPTNTNTRVYRQVSNFVATGTPRNLFLVGQSAGDGFDLEGGSVSGSTLGCLYVGFSSAGSSPVLVYGRGGTCRYNGSMFISDTSNAVAGVNVNGLMFFESWDASGAKSDGFNWHDPSSRGLYWLTLNCTALRNGLDGSVSNNGLTGHETTIGIDIAGHYRESAGCNIHFINSSKVFCVCSAPEASRGDGITGGTFTPSEFRIDDGEMWVYGGRPAPRNAGWYSYQSTGTGKLHRQNCWPTKGLDAGTGVIDTY